MSSCNLKKYFSASRLTNLLVLHSSQERWKNRRIRSQPSSPRHCRCQAEHPLPYACCAFSATICANSQPTRNQKRYEGVYEGTRPSERHRKAQDRPQRTAKPIVKFTVPLPLEPFTAVRWKQPLPYVCANSSPPGIRSDMRECTKVLDRVNDTARRKIAHSAQQNP